MLNLKYTFIVLLLCSWGLIACPDNSSDNYVDEELYRALEVLFNGNPPEAKSILIRLYGQKRHSKSVEQSIEILGRITEISYITQDYSDAYVYGLELYNLLDALDDRESLKVSLVKRICRSDDWKHGRKTFTNFCKDKSDG